MRVQEAKDIVERINKESRQEVTLINNWTSIISKNRNQSIENSNPISKMREGSSSAKRYL